DAAIGVGFDPEFGSDLIILVVVPGHQETVALVGNDRAILDPPIGIAGLGKAIEALAVEQRDPAAFTRSLWRIGQGGQPKSQRCDGGQALHENLPFILFLIPGLTDPDRFRSRAMIASMARRGKPAEMHRVNRVPSSSRTQ